MNVCWFRWKIRVRKQSGLAAIITAGAQEIKYEKAAGEIPAKGEMKKRQVKYPKRGNEKAAGETAGKGEMKKEQGGGRKFCE